MSAEGRFAPARFLIRQVAVPEPGMRVALWRELLTEADPMQALAVVERVIEAVGERREGGQVAFLALGQCLETWPALRGPLLAAATVAGRGAVLSLLADDPPLRSAEAEELRPPPLSNDREITLGERRAWARRPDRDTIDRLLVDPDPGVIANLLRNPRVVEADVLRIAARRPAPARVLGLVYRHPRWGGRRAVQAALAQNPYTPVEIATALVDLVDAAVLQSLAREPSIHPVVRGRARARLRG